LNAERVADEPFFVASPHSLGLPIAYHMGRSMAVGALPDGNNLPPRLWFAYRPGQPAEAEQADALRAADYRSERERDFGRRVSDPNGTRVALFVRWDTER